MNELPPPMAELRLLWEEDCRKLIPDFELFDEDRMGAEIVKAARDCGLESASDIQIIAHVLRNLDEDKGDVPGHWWWIAASLIIWPWVESTPWMELSWMAVYQARGKREMLTFWGSASSGKSRFFSIVTLTEMAIWIGECHAYITSPFKSSGEDKIWGYIKEESDMWLADPPEWMIDLGISMEPNKFEVTMTDSKARKSTARFVALETTASIQGKKTNGRAAKASDKRRGRLLLVGDELIVNPAACANLIKGEGNLVANKNVLTLVGMNPLPHQVTHPEAITLSAPVDRSRETLNEHQDFTWQTMRGRLFRLAWDICPNRFAREPVFHYLINHDHAEAATKRGEDNYRAQVAAWGWSGGMGNGGVLTLEAINTPEWQGEPVWRSERHRWAFFDLAFGGSDPAGYCCLETGTSQVNGMDKDVIHAVEMEKLHVLRLWKPTAQEIDEFKQLALDRGGRAPDLKPGAELKDGNAHMVLQMLRASKRLGIPKGRVSFDSSMRMDVTIMAREALGTVPWFYDGTRKLQAEQEGWPLWPPELLPSGVNKVWFDCHNRVISAVWRLAEHLIVRGNVMGLKKVTKGTQELISRMWEPSSSGSKSDVEGKKGLKADKERGGQSPIWGESLATALMFGIRFCGALPQLTKEKPVTVGGGSAFANHPVFQIKRRRISPWLWKAS